MPTIPPRTLGSAAQPEDSRRPGISSRRPHRFDDSDWKPVDLPHDWAIELPFQNDPALTSKGFYPLGRNYPETSVGWYRRVFELPAADAGKRITIEFDGVVPRNHGRLQRLLHRPHSGGYDPFSFDRHRLRNPGGPNVLLVRVDATLSDGWFYEGAGIYRHVWLVKTLRSTSSSGARSSAPKLQSGRGGPLHPHRGREPREERAERARHLDHSRSLGQEVGEGRQRRRSRSPTQKSAPSNSRSSSSSPQLWSLEERNLYKLVTEVEPAGRSSIGTKRRSAFASSSSTRRRASSSTASRSS